MGHQGAVCPQRFYYVFTSIKVQISQKWNVVDTQTSHAVLPKLNIHLWGSLLHSFIFSQLFPFLPFLQVTLSCQPVKQTTCQTPATARSRPALVSVRWTPCQLWGLMNGAAAPTGLLPVRQRRLPPLSWTAQRTHTSALTTASPAPGNCTDLL